jgi:phosphoribosylanthranilate isomerase
MHDKARGPNFHHDEGRQIGGLIVATKSRREVMTNVMQRLIFWVGV